VARRPSGLFCGASSRADRREDGEPFRYREGSFAALKRAPHATFEGTP